MHTVIFNACKAFNFAHKSVNNVHHTPCTTTKSNQCVQYVCKRYCFHRLGSLLLTNSKQQTNKKLPFLITQRALEIKIFFWGLVLVVVLLWKTLYDFLCFDFAFRFLAILHTYFVCIFLFVLIVFAFFLVLFACNAIRQ